MAEAVRRRTKAEVATPVAVRRAKEGVRARARELWEINGRPAGRDLEFWLQAERELREADRD